MCSSQFMFTFLFCLWWCVGNKAFLHVIALLAFAQQHFALDPQGVQLVSELNVIQQLTGGIFILRQYNQTFCRLTQSRKRRKTGRTLAFWRWWAAPEESPHCVNSMTFLNVFLLLKFGEGGRSSIVSRPARNDNFTHPNLNQVSTKST